jgi:hypothetical protein
MSRFGDYVYWHMGQDRTEPPGGVCILYARTEAAQLVDRALPNVPVRQWVLSLPWELRAAAAMKPGVIGAMDRLFAQEIARLTRRLAGVDGAQTGSVGCPQIFG